MNRVGARGVSQRKHGSSERGTTAHERSPARIARSRWIAPLALAAAAMLLVVLLPRLPFARFDRKSLAAGLLPVATANRLEFDGNRAFELLRRQCEYGPRPPGSLAHEKTRAYLLGRMKEVTDETAAQDFTATYRGKQHRLTNIIGVLNPDAPKKLMISAHWDTRPTADEEGDPADRQKPILGANDGASGVAVVLELARALKAKKVSTGLVFMLFDGEDLGPSVGNMFLGARHFARNMGKNRPERMILVDMVGDADLRIYQEGNSLNSDRELVRTVWDTAERLGYGAKFPNEMRYTIEDDHVPMIRAGIPSIDLIDFDYPYWHTLEDTVERCDPKSLEAVGRTLQAVIEAMSSAADRPSDA